MLGLCRDNGKENGNYRDKKDEKGVKKGLYRDYRVSDRVM